MDAQKIGSFIKNRRVEKNLNQNELAKMLHVSRATVSKWETGINFPGLQNLEDLSKILDFPLTQLFNLQESADAAPSPESIPPMPAAVSPDSASPAPPAKPKITIKGSVSAIIAAVCLITAIASLTLYYNNRPPVFTVLKNFHAPYEDSESCCFIVTCEGKFSEDAWFNYTSTFREKYYICFTQVDAIVVTYFKDYDENTDTLDTADYITVLYPYPEAFFDY